MSSPSCLVGADQAQGPAASPPGRADPQGAGNQVPDTQQRHLYLQVRHANDRVSQTIQGSQVQVQASKSFPCGGITESREHDASAEDQTKSAHGTCQSLFVNVFRIVARIACLPLAREAYSTYATTAIARRLESRREGTEDNRSLLCYSCDDLSSLEKYKCNL